MLEFILNLLFPKKCAGCNIEGDWFCADCVSRIEYYDPPFLRLQNGFLDGILIVAVFKNPLKEAIHAFKYDKVKELRQVLSLMLSKHLKKSDLSFSRVILIPVPLSKHRELERGFNQASLLADGVSDQLHLAVCNNALVRIKNTPPQIELKKDERIKNVKGIFKFVGEKKKIQNKTVLLVDDVTTTGSTLNECAKILKKAGAKRVWGLVLARG